MKGLEISVLNLSDCKEIIDFRIDANTYKKDYLKTEEILKLRGFKTIEDISVSVQNFGAYSLCNFINFTEEGIPFLMTENIRNNYIDWNVQKFVDLKSHELLYKSHCRRGQVLVTMAGEYLGRVAVYDKDFVCSSNQAIAKISFDTNQNPYIISTFLNTKYGQNQINRLKTITGQPNINMSLIKSLKIISFDSALSNLIEKIVRSSELSRNLSKDKYSEAESLFLVNANFEKFSPLSTSVNIKSFKDFINAERFDAEYYHPKYEELFKTIYNQQHKSLGSLVNIKKSIEPGSAAYQEEGIPFVRVSNLTKFGISTPEIHLNSEQYGEIIKPRKNTILLSKDGSVGIAYKVENDLNCITSGAILHLELKVKNVLPDYLTLVLNSLVVRMQAERDAGGSIIQHWKPSEIQQVLIPILKENIQQQVADLVKESFRLKAQSENLLKIAKQAVEIAVEESDMNAIKFIMEKNI